MSSLRNLAICASALVIVTIAAAQVRDLSDIRLITPGELALTPEFCQDVQAINGWGKEAHDRSPRAPRWVSIFGDTFWAMHHYCWGLIKLHRANTPGIAPQMRSGLRRSAIDEYGYVIRHSKPDFILLPEMYFRIGEAHALLGEHPLAVEAYAKARSLKPTYWPPYIGEADVLVAMGRNTQARSLIASGLQQLPNQPQLQAYLQRMDARAPRAAAPAVDARRGTPATP